MITPVSFPEFGFEERQITEQMHTSVADHATTFAPTYGKYDLSDHGPMAALALRGLGEADGAVGDYLAAYNHRLSPITRAPQRYREALRYFSDEIARSSIEDTLARHLPPLISGWARAAYHPLIRIAYGFEWRCAPEVAAGLAYLSYCRADPTIERLARNAKESDLPATDLFALATGFATTGNLTTFSRGLALVVTHREFSRAAQIVPDNLRQMSRAALDVFASTHNFFALHLVTGSHAYRLLEPFAGERSAAIFNLGLLAGYAIVGAPEFEPTGTCESAAQPAVGPGELAPAAGWRDGMSDDEHDIKLAYSAQCQADYWADARYIEVARGYFSRN